MTGKRWIPLILLLLLRLSQTSNTLDPCHPLCTCKRKPPEVIVECTNGGIDQSILYAILTKVPKDTTVLRVEGPEGKPNNFGVTLNFRILNRISELHLINCGLKTLGVRTFAKLEYLRTLNVEKNNITHINIRTFENTNLDYLNMARNHLSDASVPTASFAFLKRLRRLDLSGNDFRHFVGGVFTGLDKLEDLTLDHNSLSAKGIQKALAAIPNLQRLSLNNCNLKGLTPKTFASVRSLHSLSMAFNDYGYIPSDQIMQLTSLKALDLAGNKLNFVPEDAFAGMSLTHLNLAYNGLGGVSPQPKTHPKGLLPLSFRGLSLRYLDLSYNDYYQFRSETLGLAAPTLDTLVLSGNPLKSMLAEQVLGLRLKELHISDIGLSGLPDKLPFDIGRLEVFNVSSNPLKTLDHRSVIALSGAPKLRTLDISRCQISRLPSNSYDRLLPKLKNVLLHRNPWDCHCQISRLRNYLLEPSQKTRCGDLRINSILCAYPAELLGTPVVKVAHPPDCAVIFDATRGLTRKSEIGILVAATLGVILLATALAAFACYVRGVCWTCAGGRGATYKTREESRSHLSASSTSGSSDGGDCHHGGMHVECHHHGGMHELALNAQTERLF